MSSDLLVIGLGYVGLPLACEASLARLRVVGFDLDERVTAKLNKGTSHVDTVSDAAVAEMVARGFRATTWETEIDAPETVIICVPTPLSPDGIPDLDAVRGAAELVGRILRPGMLVILESTSYPGTTDEVVRPMVEKISGLNAGTDFQLAFSPERIDPGNKTYGLRNIPKVVGGYTTTCADAAARFYGKQAAICFLDPISLSGVCCAPGRPHVFGAVRSSRRMTMSLLMNEEPDHGVRLTEQQVRARRARSIAIAVALGVLVVLFYIVTLVKGPAVLVRPL